MASVAYRQIDATCNARRPVPPEGASDSDRSRLFELCGLLRRYQKGKDSLETRARLANLGGSAYHYGFNGKGKKEKILKNSEFLVAQCLLAEGHVSAVPVGWQVAAPKGVNYLDIHPGMPAQAAAPQAVVYDMPSVPPA